MNEEQLEEERLDLEGEDEVTLGNHHIEDGSCTCHCHMRHPCMSTACLHLLWCDCKK